MLMALFVVALGLTANIAMTDRAYAQNKTLKLYFTHTKERGKFTFKKNGRYDRAVLKKLNHFLRDWRRNEPTDMDPRLFDLLWEVYRQSGAKNYIHVVSAYRSPATNEMLRKTRGGQATKSQHMVGRAIDFFVPGVKTSKLREIGMKLQGGGVGYYPRSNTPFVHLDVASVRAWPRMSRQELVRLFPDGKTLHLPPDGKPLPGYRTALAEYKRRKGGIDTNAQPASRPQTQIASNQRSNDSRQSGSTEQDNDNDNGARRAPNLLAALFNRNRDNEAANDANARTQIAGLAQTARNDAALPRTNIPVPSLSGSGLNGEATVDDPLAVAGDLPQVSDDQTFVAALPVPPDDRPASAVDAAVASIEATINAAIPSAPNETAPLDETPSMVADNRALEPNLVNDSAEPELAREIAALAYANEEPVSASMADFASIMVAAIESDRMRKENGEIPVPAMGAFKRQEPVQTFDIAALEPPILKPHNKKARMDLSRAIFAAAEDANRKSGRPNMRDAMAFQHKANRAQPDVQTIQITARAFSKKRLENMTPPKSAPQFVNRFMRVPPKIIYAQGFSRENKLRGGTSAFAGSAVNFLPIVRYGS